jgi:hypothetical protein
MNPSRVEKGPPPLSPPCYGISQPAQLETASNSRLAPNLLCENSAPPPPPLRFIFPRIIIYSLPPCSVGVNYHIKSGGGLCARLSLYFVFTRFGGCGCIIFCAGSASQLSLPWREAAVRRSKAFRAPGFAVGRRLIWFCVLGQSFRRMCYVMSLDRSVTFGAS